VAVYVFYQEFLLPGNAETFLSLLTTEQPFAAPHAVATCPFVTASGCLLRRVTALYLTSTPL
jgi:hypothetical protein